MKYNVTMTGLARMRGGLSIEAETPEDAKALALTRARDVLWEYQGMEDETVEVESVEEVTRVQ